MKSSFFQRHPQIADILSVIIFIFAVIAGTIFINSFVFRSYNVIGGSMEETLHDGDRILVNRLPVTWANLQNKDFEPARGDIIVFQNPSYTPGMKDQFIVKRVIAFAGEKVTVKDGKLTVFNDENPNGFNPDDDFNGEPKKYTSHSGSWQVPDKEFFVSGDNREGDNSFDSRSGLGTIPIYDIIGPAGVRVYPFNKLRLF